jgi:hypothetical protein
MTSVYGVTFMGARDQIWNRQALAPLSASCPAHIVQLLTAATRARLKERKAFEHQAENKAAALYAARKVLDALGNMFVNARNVMDWLNECARDIAQHGASRMCAQLEIETAHCVCGSFYSLFPVRLQRAPSDGARRWACQWYRCVLFALCVAACALAEPLLTLPSSLASPIASAASALCKPCCKHSPSRACASCFLCASASQASACA